jgi:hypothetical protein
MSDERPRRATMRLDTGPAHAIDIIEYGVFWIFTSMGTVRRSNMRFTAHPATLITQDPVSKMYFELDKIPGVNDHTVQ